VRKVLSGHAKQAAQAAEKGAASNRKWYEIIANNHLASVCAAIFASASTANSTEAEQTLKNVSKEDQLVKEVIRQMCLGCERTSGGKNV